MRSFLWCAHLAFLKLSKIYAVFLTKHAFVTFVSDDIGYSCQVLGFSSHACMVCVCMCNDMCELCALYY